MGTTFIAITQVDAFVVVSWWQDESSNGRKGHYSYEHGGSLNEATDLISGDLLRVARRKRSKENSTATTL